MDEKINVLSAGERFTFKDLEWVTLGESDGGILAIMTDIWKTLSFSSNENNNYKDSNVRKALLTELLPVLGEENLLPHVMDLISDDGQDDYGTVTDKVFILSCDEYRWYRKFMPTYDDGVWTCTPWIITPTFGDHRHVRSIYTDGTLYNATVFNSFGVTPACVLNPENLKLRRQAQVLEKTYE